MRAVAGLSLTMGIALALAFATPARADTLGYLSDTEIVAWGHDAYGQCAAPTTYDFARMASGWYHSLAVKTDGSLAAWGWDSLGQVSNAPSGGSFTQIRTCHNLGTYQEVDSGIKRNPQERWLSQLR